MASEIKVDTISEKTSANGVTIDGVSLKDSKIATANSVDSDAYVDGSIDAVHLSANSVDSDAYVDGSIDTAHIGATQVTGAKLNTDVISAQTALAVAPADTDEFLVSDAGTLKRIDYSLIKGGGITEADTWRQTTASNISTGSAYITSNWERDDSYGNGLLGTGLSESSGIFSFPSTGFWYVHFSLYGQNDNGSNALRHYKGELFVTTDNSTYNKVAVGVDSNSGTTTVNTYLGATPAFKIIDVTNTTNVKFQCGYNVHANVAYSGSTNENQTFVMAMKLGDT